MSSARLRRGLALGIALAAAAATSSQARETETFVLAREAAGTERARAFLLPVPFYLVGEPHAPVARVLATSEVTRSTSGVLRSDRAACAAAFLDALKILQEKAQKAGADAIVDVVSITNDVEYESASAVRCIAGSVVVHVGLRGRLATLGDADAASGPQDGERPAPPTDLDVR